MKIGDEVMVIGGTYSAVVREVWRDDGACWCVLDRELGNGLRVSYEWPEYELERVQTGQT